MSRRRTFPPCPSCDSTERPLRILYGYPDQRAVELAESGKAALGGCMVGPESPAYECRSCGAALPWPARRGVAYHRPRLHLK